MGSVCTNVYIINITMQVYYIGSYYSTFCLQLLVSSNSNIVPLKTMNDSEFTMENGNISSTI